MGNSTYIHTMYHARTHIQNKYYTIASEYTIYNGMDSIICIQNISTMHFGQDAVVYHIYFIVTIKLYNSSYV